MAVTVYALVMLVGGAEIIDIISADSFGVTVFRFFGQARRGDKQTENGLIMVLGRFVVIIILTSLQQVGRISYTRGQALLYGARIGLSREVTFCLAYMARVFDSHVGRPWPVPIGHSRGGINFIVRGLEEGPRDGQHSDTGLNEIRGTQRNGIGVSQGLELRSILLFQAESYCRFV